MARTRLVAGNWKMHGSRETIRALLDAIVAGAFLVVIVLIIPYGVFTRYVLNSAASWPEPLATLLMIVVTSVTSTPCLLPHSLAHGSNHLS